MSLIRWDDNFLVGVEEIDEHAKQFVSLLNLINEEFTRGDPAARAASLLCTLASLGQFHFEYEERLMHNLKFPGLLAHKEEHHSFLTRVACSRDLSGGGHGEFLDFLGRWAHRHFHEIHAEFRDYSRDLAGGR